MWLLLSISERLLVFVALFYLGWYQAGKSPELARKLAQGLCLIPLAMLVLLAISGRLSLEPASFAKPVHHSLGKWFPIAVWHAVPVALGTLWHGRASRVARIAQSLAFALLIGTSFLASFTGYLGGSPHEETQNRFLVLHMFALPTLIGLLSVSGVLMLRVRRR